MSPDVFSRLKQLAKGTEFNIPEGDNGHILRTPLLMSAASFNQNEASGEYEIRYMSGYYKDTREKLGALIEQALEQVRQEETAQSQVVSNHLTGGGTIIYS